MQLHEKGAKAERDRALCIRKYDELVGFFHIKRLMQSQIATMTNTQLYRLCEDEYNRQPNRKKLAYTEWLGLTPRQNPLAFKWFASDMLKIKQPANLAEKLYVYIQLPFRYPGFLRRKIRRLRAEQREAREAMQQMSDAAKAPVSMKECSKP